MPQWTLSCPISIAQFLKLLVLNHYFYFYILLFTVYTDPWIACPIDRVEELESNRSTVVLGYKWQLPRTNMKNVTVSPSNYDENYPFPVGRHRVTWIGTSDSGTQKSCSLFVTVNGELIDDESSCVPNLHLFQLFPMIPFLRWTRSGGMGQHTWAVST